MLDDLSTIAGHDENPVTSTSTSSSTRCRFVRSSTSSSTSATSCTTSPRRVGVRLIVEQPVQTLVTNVRGTESSSSSTARFGKRVLSRRRPRCTATTATSDRSWSRPPDLWADDASSWAYADSKADGRVPRARAPRRARPRLRHRPFVQHRRPAPERAVRHGDPELRSRAMRSTAPLEIHGDGNQTRCSATSGHDPRLEGLMRREPPGEIFNVGSEERISHHRSRRRVIDLTDSRVRRSAYVPL